MSEKNPIDDLFRDKLDGAGIEYTPEYWEQMDALINKKKRRSSKKTVKTIALVAALLLLLIPIVYFTTEKIKEHTTDNGQKSNISETEKPGNENLKTMDIEIKKPSNNKAIDILTEAEATTAETSKSAPSRAKSPKTEIHQVDDNQTVPESLENSETQNVTEIEINKPDQKQNPVAPEPTTSGANLLEAEIAQVDGDQSAPVQMNENSENSEGQIDTYAGSPTEIGLPLVLMPSVESVLPVSSQNEINENITLRPSIKPKLKSPYLNIYAAPFFNYGLIQHRSDEAVAQWKSSREETQPYINYGLDLRLQQKQFGLLAGVGIMQWSEITNYTRQLDKYTFDTTLYMVSRNYKQRPDSSYVALLGTRIDTTSHATSDTVYCPDCKAKFEYFTLPIAFRYEINQGSWQYFTEVGISLSFLLKAQGEYSTQWNLVDNEKNGMQIDDSGKKYFTRTLIHSALSVGVKYSPTPNLGINVRLHYARAINSMMQLYNQYPDLYGIGLGVEYGLY